MYALSFLILLEMVSRHLTFCRTGHTGTCSSQYRVNGNDCVCIAHSAA